MLHSRSILVGVIAPPLTFINKYILIEMPIIFFISGAASTFTKQRKYRDYLKNKTKRIGVPLALWFVITVILSLSLYLIFGDLPKGFQSEMGIPFCKHVWFYRPFVCVMLIAPFLRKFCSSKAKTFKLLAIIIVAIPILDYLNYLKHVPVISEVVGETVAYGFFFVMGFLYKKMKVNFWYIILGIAVASIGMWLKDNTYYNTMGDNKWPPTLAFTLYNLGVILILSYVVKFIHLPNNRFMDNYNKNGYTIYLYQNWGFTLFFPIMMLFSDKVVELKSSGFGSIILMLVVMVALFFVHHFLSKAVCPLEKHVMNSKYCKWLSD